MCFQIKKGLPYLINFCHMRTWLIWEFKIVNYLHSHTWFGFWLRVGNLTSASDFFFIFSVFIMIVICMSLIVSLHSNRRIKQPCCFYYIKLMVNGVNGEIGRPVRYHVIMELWRGLDSAIIQPLTMVAVHVWVAVPSMIYAKRKNVEVR